MQSFALNWAYLLFCHSNLLIETVVRCLLGHFNKPVVHGALRYKNSTMHCEKTLPFHIQEMQTNGIPRDAAAKRTTICTLE